MGTLVVEVVKTVVGGVVTVALARWSFKRRLDDITDAAEQAARRSGRVEHHVQDLKRAVTPPPYPPGDVAFPAYAEVPQEKSQAEHTNPRIVLAELQAKAKPPEK